MEYTAQVKVHAINGGEQTKGWVHTHGMSDYDLPELEMRNVPLFLVPYAYHLLREICDYMLTDDPPVQAGHTMELGHARFRFVHAVPIPGEEYHYDSPCLQIADVDAECDCCSGC
jgi:hypothetical protein